MLTLVHSHFDTQPNVANSRWRIFTFPRVLRTGKTKCCFTNHYQLNDGVAICINENCSNYFRETHILKRHRLKRFLTGFWLFLFLAVFTFDDYSHPGAAQFNFKKPDAPLTAENLRTELHNDKVLCPDEVYAQMMLESGNLKSFLVKRTNNMLGMRFPFRRVTMACGLYIPSQDTIIKGDAASLKKLASTNHYAVYDRWQDAVKDYKIWQEQHFSVNERYLLFLGNVYAEDSEYVSKIKSVMKHSEALTLAK
jgi:hypothetical protein